MLVRKKICSQTQSDGPCMGSGDTLMFGTIAVFCTCVSLPIWNRNFPKKLNLEHHKCELSSKRVPKNPRTCGTS